MKMNKEERIKRYGKEADEKMEQQARDWHANNPEKVVACNREISHKGGKWYEQHLKYNTSGIQGERHVIRKKHGHRYHPYKKIIAPESQIHHEWTRETANYTGVALVEKDQHMHGFIDVIQILEGEITLLSEEEIRNRRA